MTVLKNSLRPNGDKQHDLGRDGIRWNKLWVGDINADGIIYNNNAILRQTYVFETTYSAQIPFQGLLSTVFTTPNPNISNPILIKIPNIVIATAITGSGLSRQFRLVVNGIEIPPSKTELAVVEADTFIKFNGQLLGTSIDITAPAAASNSIVVWYVPDLNV
jgi:hypothetical protein